MATREERGGQFVSRTAEVSTVLAGNATRNGEAQSGHGFSRFRAFASSDVAGTLSIQQSDDQVTWYTTVSDAVAAGATLGTVVESMVTLAYVRAVYVNGAGAQASFKFSSALLGV